ncbi:alpha/beta fold hydrolase [Nitriliruptor alkaliphilus]|uniref:alpha/beta fold hydrolase n=1 Tax=Nitriliruptor alkaliphilus TaxID=427918 RepID=UPI00069904D3|nr:alpha/beta hydrolase [Nitriliruptor alkaliphilus]
MGTKGDGRRRAAARADLAAAEARLFAALDLPLRERWIELADGPVRGVRVLETGAGPPLVLLHGAGAGAAMWAPLLARLPDHHAIAVDLPGCGASDPFDVTGVDLRGHAVAFLSALLDALELPSVTVVGNSLGGSYALYAAAAGDARLASLLLLGATGVALPGGRATPPMALLSRPWVGRIAGTLTPRMSPSLSRRFFASIVGRPAVDAVPVEMFAVTAALADLGGPTFRALMPELFTGRTVRAHLPLTDDELRAIDTPTRFVWGRDDVFQRPADGARAAALMPTADHVDVPGGHQPWWDDAGTCAALLREHLETRDDPSTSPS